MMMMMMMISLGLILLHLVLVLTFWCCFLSVVEYVTFQEALSTVTPQSNIV